MIGVGETGLDMWDTHASANKVRFLEAIYYPLGVSSCELVVNIFQRCDGFPQSLKQP